MTILLWLGSLLAIGIGTIVGLAAAQITVYLVAADSFEWPILILWLIAFLLLWMGIHLMPITVVVVTP